MLIWSRLVTEATFANRAAVLVMARLKALKNKSPVPVSSELVLVEPKPAMPLL